MNPARSVPLDCLNFLVAAQKSFTCSRAARCQLEAPGAPAHDAFTRLLWRQPPDTEALWQETGGWCNWKGACASAGRYHPGQAPCPQDGTDNPSLERQTPPCGVRHQPADYFDSWYSSLENLKQVRDCGWVWLTQLRCNRRVNPDEGGNVRVDAVEIPTEGRVVHCGAAG